MKQSSKLNSLKVLKRIRTYRRQLKVSMQSGSDFRQLHSDVLRLLKVICGTKSEYKDVVAYPEPPAIREIVVMEHGPDSEPVELERTPLFSEESLNQSRKELGVQLQTKLAELDSEYLLRSKLETTAACNSCNYRTDVKSIKKELQGIKNEMFRLSHEIASIQDVH